MLGIADGGLDNGKEAWVYLELEVSAMICGIVAMQLGFLGSLKTYYNFNIKDGNQLKWKDPKKNQTKKSTIVGWDDH